MRLLYGLTLWLLIGSCSEKGDMGCEKSDVSLQLVTENGYGVDSALVFFMKVTSDRSDSMVYRSLLHSLTQSNYQFKVDLPVGKYMVILIGNADQNRIGSFGRFSSEDTFIEYTDGMEPPPLFYGSAYTVIGENSSVEVRMKRATSQVEVLLDSLPARIEWIDVALINTGSMMSLGGNYPAELNTEAITKTVRDVVTDSSYSVFFSSFPSVKDILSWVQVRCYDSAGSLIYSGNSAKFLILPGVYTKLKGTFTKTNKIRLSESF